MSSVTLDAATIEKLKGPGTKVEVRDPDGSVVGYFRPLARVYKEGEIPEFSEDEIRDALAGPWLTTDQVLRRLGESQ